MKKIIFLVAISAFPLIGHTQTEVKTEVLDENYVSITLSDGGILLAEPNPTMYGNPSWEMVLPGCEYPKGSGNHIMNGLSMWFGGVNELEEPRTSAPTRGAYEDQFAGPITTGSLESYFSGFDAFYAVSREEINFHVTNFQNPNYVMPEAIERWPAHGDPSIGMDWYLAPFVDVDADGIYNPYTGDYPCIQGDRAVYMIMNDVKGQSYCGVPRNVEHIGIEIHYLFYQYSSIPELANTTFCKARVINRSDSDYKDFSASMFMNASVGSSQDDFMGTDVERNMMYAYNGDEVDQVYGIQVPAVGIVSLKNSIDRSRVFGDYPNYGYHFPSFPPEFWQVMQGKLLTGENYPKRFAYPGDPILQEGDVQSLSEQARSMIYTIDIGDFASGDEHELDFALVVGQGATNMGSIRNLRESVDLVQEFYNESTVACAPAVEGIPATIDPPESPTTDQTTAMYPNPSNGEFTIEVDEDWIGADLSVYTGSGLMLYNLKSLPASQNVKLTQGPGVYLVTLKKDGASKIFKAVVE